MIGCVFDVEATGLREHMLRDPEAQIHCLMAQELEVVDGELVKMACREFYDVPMDAEGNKWNFMGNLSGVPEYLSSMSFVAGHNIIDYDLPILEHHLGVSLDCQIVDTLIISRKNWADRPGGHSVEAWAKRMGMFKPVQEDWTAMTASVRNRCREDVMIETNLLYLVLQEMYEGVEKCQ